MPQTIRRGIKSLVDEANSEIETLSAAEAISAAQRDDVVIVDIRDPRELEREGRIPGAFSCTRGMLEFWIDPLSPYAKPVFQQDKKFIFLRGLGRERRTQAARAVEDELLVLLEDRRGVGAQRIDPEFQHAAGAGKRAGNLAVA